jgi:hypothetical protein
LNLAGATEIDAPAYVNGTIDKVPCYRRGSRVLPLTGAFRTVVDALHQASDIAEILRILGHSSQDRTFAARAGFERALQCLEVMLAEEWVVGKLDRKKPRLNMTTPDARESDRDVLHARGLHLHDPAEEE